jgi:alpha-glucosidase
LVNSLGLSGMPNSGYDVGGFGGECNINTFARWIAVGAFCPFFRNHKMIDAKDSEPWSYGERVEEISRNYISLRYKIMPYLYSAFYEASTSGMPVARSLAINYTHDPMIYDGKYQNQYFFGNGLLIAPITGPTTITKVYLPKGNDWYDWYNDSKSAGGNEIYVETPLEKIPVFVKGSSIIPMQTLVQHAGEKPSDTLFLHIYKGSENNTFVYYEDAGDGYDYQSGDFHQREINYISSKNELNIEKSKGNRNSKFSLVKVYFHGFGDVKSVKVNGLAKSISKENYKLMNDMPQFDPIGKGIAANQSLLSTVVLSNSKDKISLKW